MPCIAQEKVPFMVGFTHSLVTVQLTDGVSIVGGVAHEKLLLCGSQSPNALTPPYDMDTIAGCVLVR